jgi:hypothetical protein
VSAEYNVQTTFSGFLAMVMVHVMPIAVSYAMGVNHFATNVASTAWMHRWRHEKIARIDPAQRN